MVPYTTFSPLPSGACERASLAFSALAYRLNRASPNSPLGGLFSVALSLKASRRSLPAGVTRGHALWYPDFPRWAVAYRPTARAQHSNLLSFYTVSARCQV